jgi:hypothetical protein
MDENKSQLLTLLGKLWAGFLYVVIGMSAKLAYDLSKKNITLREALISGIICLFVGYLSFAICEYKGWTQQAGIIVPICTFVSDKFVLFITANWKQIVATLLGLKVPDKDEEEKND